jgi:SNF2 family DNA or RNA helicase
MMHGSAPLVSLQRSRVIPTECQLVPVVMALNIPRVRSLIADDVGLGKTVEAGLVVTELLSRQMARNVLVVCPANFLHVLWYDTSILLQLLITILTFVSAGIVAYSTYLKNISDPTNTFVYATVGILLIITFALAVFKLIADYRKL